MNFKNNKINLSSLLAIVCVLTMATAALASGGGESNSLSPEKLKDLGWRAMNFAVLAVVLVKFLGKPISNALNNRRMLIVSKFEDLDQRRSEVEQTYKTYESKFAEIDKEVQKILDSAKEQGEAQKNKIIEDANRAADDIKRKAQLSVQNELSEAKKTLKEDIAEQAAVIAEEIIRKSLTEDDQNKLVEDYLEKVGTLR